MDILFVSCLFDLKKREGNSRRDISFYLDHGKKLLDLNINIVIFCDPELKKELEKIKRTSKTYILAYNLECPYNSSRCDKIKELRDKNSLINANKEKDTPWYTLIGWSKLLFLNYVSSKYNSEYVVWVDFGICHVAENYQKLLEIKPSNNFKVLSLRPTYIEQISDSSFFNYIQGRSAGGILSIPSKRTKEYLNMFDTAAMNFLDRGYSPMEEEIITFLRITYPEKFDIYFGDYCDIIRNFNDEIFSEEGIIQLAFSEASRYSDKETLKKISTQIYNNLEYLKEKISEEHLESLLSYK